MIIIGYNKVLKCDVSFKMAAPHSTMKFWKPGKMKIYPTNIEMCSF